jgi:hypothetical protein
MPLVIKDSKVVYEKPTKYPVIGSLLCLNTLDQMYKNHAKIRNTSVVMNHLQLALLSKDFDN